MSNHFHLLARFPDNNMSEAMNYFMRETSRVISRDAGRINQTYGSRYFRSVIAKPIYYEHVYKYLYRNPVEAKICSKVEDYPYSTIQIRLGLRTGIIPLINDPLIENNPVATLEWLNRNVKPDDQKEVRKALQRPIFGLPTRLNGDFVHHLEINRL